MEAESACPPATHHLLHHHPLLPCPSRHLSRTRGSATRRRCRPRLTDWPSSGSRQAGTTLPCPSLTAYTAAPLTQAHAPSLPCTLRGEAARRSPLHILPSFYLSAAPFAFLPCLPPLLCDWRVSWSVWQLRAGGTSRGGQAGGALRLPPQRALNYGGVGGVRAVSLGGKGFRDRVLEQGGAGWGAYGAARGGARRRACCLKRGGARCTQQNGGRRRAFGRRARLQQGTGGQAMRLGRAGWGTAGAKMGLSVVHRKRGMAEWRVFVNRVLRRQAMGSGCSKGLHRRGAVPRLVLPRTHRRNGTGRGGAARLSVWVSAVPRHHSMPSMCGSMPARCSTRCQHRRLTSSVDWPPLPGAPAPARLGTPLGLGFQLSDSAGGRGEGGE